MSYNPALSSQQIQQNKSPVSFLKGADDEFNAAMSSLDVQYDEMYKPTIDFNKAIEKKDYFGSENFGWMDNMYSEIMEPTELQKRQKEENLQKIKQQNQILYQQQQLKEQLRQQQLNEQKQQQQFNKNMLKDVDGKKYQQLKQQDQNTPYENQYLLNNNNLNKSDFSYQSPVFYQQQNLQNNINNSYGNQQQYQSQNIVMGQPVQIINSQYNQPSQNLIQNNSSYQHLYVKQQQMNGFCNQYQQQVPLQDLNNENDINVDILHVKHNNYNYPSE